ncbi:MAG: serine hydrolase domain-containing protein [Bacteroidota bacterium]
MKKILFIGCVLLFLGCQQDDIIAPSVYSCELIIEDNFHSHPKSERFESAMRKVLEITPGVQIAVRSEDGNLWLGSQGFADIANQAPFENCTQTMVGSVSKIYTAVATLQLQDDGILSIEDPISDWISPEMVQEIENADQVSIKQLLNHTSGIRDYLAAEHFVNSLNTPYFKLSPEEKMEYIYGRSAELPPNTRYSYSNSNYVLLGLIVEKARNMPFEQVIEEYISTPLGLKMTVMGTTEEPIPVTCARPYLALNNGNYFDVYQFGVADAATGDGGIATNMYETLTFIEAIFDNTLVSENTLALMLSETAEDSNRRLYSETNVYGLGLRQHNTENGLLVGHSGSTSAYRADLYHFPERGVTFAIAFNGDTEQDKEYIESLDLILELIDIAFE